MKYNKRFLALMLVLAVALSLAACAKAPAPAPGAPSKPDTASSDPAPAFDTAAYDAAVRAVKDEFISVIEAGLDAFDEEQHPELPWYTAVLTRYDENRYYAAHYDFDGNGTAELLIGVGDGQSVTPIAVYAFDGAAMRYLCKERPLGERSYLSRADGLFVVHGSGSAFSGDLTVYRIAPDGWNTEIVDVIDYQFTDAEHVSYTSQNGVISPKEVVSRGLADSVGLDVSPDWTLFYPAD